MVIPGQASLVTSRGRLIGQGGGPGKVGPAIKQTVNKTVTGPVIKMYRFGPETLEKKRLMKTMTSTMLGGKTEPLMTGELIFSSNFPIEKFRLEGFMWPEKNVATNSRKNSIGISGKDSDGESDGNSDKTFTGRAVDRFGASSQENLTISRPGPVTEAK